MNLSDKIIISTRPVSECDTIRDYLSSKGAEVIDFPMIEVVSSEIDDKIKNIISNISAFKMLIFTSKNGVEHFFKIINEYQPNLLSQIKTINIAVIGDTTAKELIKYNLKPYYTCKGRTSEDLSNELLKAYIKKDDNILLILGELASDTIERNLSQIAKIQRIDVYKTNETKYYNKKIIQKIINDKYNLLIFTSPSGFRNFMKIMNEYKCRNVYKIACIGTTTEKEIRKYNQIPQLVASKPDGLMFAKEIEQFLR